MHVRTTFCIVTHFGKYLLTYRSMSPRCVTKFARSLCQCDFKVLVCDFLAITTLCAKIKRAAGIECATFLQVKAFSLARSPSPFGPEFAACRPLRIRKMKIT